MPKKVCGFGFDCASMLLQPGLEPAECPNYSTCGRATRLTPDEEVELIRVRQEQQAQQQHSVQQQYQYQQEVWRTTRRQLATEMLLRRGCPQAPEQYIPSETFQQLTETIAHLQQQLTAQFQDSYIPPEGTVAHRYWVHRAYGSYPYNKLMAPSALFAPAQEEQNVRMIHLSQDDDPRNLEARKGITRMQQLVTIRSQLQLAQAALDQAIELAEAVIEPYWADSSETELG